MSAKKISQQEVGFKIKSIRVLEKSVVFEAPEKISQDGINYQIAINVGQNKDTQSVSNTLAVLIKNSDSESIYASFKIQCEYEFLNFNDIFDGKETSANLSSQVIETLNIITIGTVRGIMFSELSGTWLQDEILPVIDPNSFKEQK